MKKQIIFNASKSVEDISQELETNSQNSSIYIKVKLVKEKEFIDLLVDHLKNKQHYVDVSIHISKFVLISNRGYEKIAQSLQQLTKVQILSLRFENNCQIGPGEIMHFSDCIKNLNLLQNLSIIIYEYNYILNQGLESISNSLPLLPNLKTLTIQIIHPNRYDEQGIIHFCEKLKLLSQLTFLELQLDGEEIYQDGIKALATALKNLQNLNQLGLQINFGNQLFDEGALDLARVFEQLTNLKDLKIVIFQFSKNKPMFYVDLSNILRQLKQLESLYIEGIPYFIDRQSIDSFSDKFNNIPVLKKLVLKLDNLNFDSLQVFQSIFNALEIFQNLEDLSLIILTNFINGAEDLADLAQAIKGMKNLTSLNINISQEVAFKGIQCVGEALGELKQLKSLILTFRNNEEGIQAIAEGIKKLTNLVKLEINISQKNVISQNGIFLLGQSLFQLRNLRELNFDLSEKIANLGILGFAEGFKGLNNLQNLTLCLQLSHFDQDNKKQFFKSFKYLTNVQKLEIQTASSCLKNQTNINISDLSIMFSYLQNLTDLKVNLSLEKQNIQNYADFEKALSSLNKVVNLNLNINENSSDQLLCQSLLKGIKNLYQIETLRFTFAKDMNLNSSKLFVEVFKNKIHLKKLHLDLQIGDLGILNDIGESFSNLQNLKKIEFLFFSISIYNEGGICIDRFGNGLGYLKNLRDIQLIFMIQSLSFQNNQSILKGIKSLKNLERVSAKIFNNTEQAFEILDLINCFENLQYFDFHNSQIFFDLSKQAKQIKEEQQLNRI